MYQPVLAVIRYSKKNNSGFSKKQEKNLVI